MCYNKDTPKGQNESPRKPSIFQSIIEIAIMPFPLSSDKSWASAVK